MMSGIAYTTAPSISMHGADQNAFGVSSPRETRNANRNSSCKHSILAEVGFGPFTILGGRIMNCEGDK
jgi:hypothetical protein